MRTGPATEMESSSSSCPVSPGSPLLPALIMRNVFVFTQVLFLGVEMEPPPVYGSDVSLETNGPRLSNLPSWQCCWYVNPVQ